MGGFAQLLLLKDNVDAVIQKRNVKSALHNIDHIPPQQQLTLTTDTQTQQMEYNQLADCYERVRPKTSPIQD